MFHLGCRRPLSPSPAKYRHGNVESGVRRGCACPSAIRAYRFPSVEVAAPSAECSAVLRKPSLDFTHSQLLVAMGASPLMLTVWPDTTVEELSVALLRHVREDADRLFVVSQSAVEEEVTENSARGGVDSRNLRASKYFALRAVYVVKFSTSIVNADGSMLLSVPIDVELRQVVEGEPYVLPVRRAGGADLDASILSLPYRFGNPLFFSCLRVR